jgi:hypothetical protein
MQESTHCGHRCGINDSCLSHCFLQPSSQLPLFMQQLVSSFRKVYVPQYGMYNNHVLLRSSVAVDDSETFQREDLPGSWLLCCPGLGYRWFAVGGGPLSKLPPSQPLTEVSPGLEEDNELFGSHAGPSCCISRLPRCLVCRQKLVEVQFGCKSWGFPSQFINQPRGYGSTVLYSSISGRPRSA